MMRTNVIVANAASTNDQIRDRLRFGPNVACGFVAHDGQSAINLAAEVRPQIIFLDIGMPGMNGHEVAHQLRRQAETRDALLVAVTGWSQDKDRERSRVAGISHHLTKPVDVKQLLPILASVRLRAAA